MILVMLASSASAVSPESYVLSVCVVSGVLLGLCVRHSSQIGAVALQHNERHAWVVLGWMAIVPH